MKRWQGFVSEHMEMEVIDESTIRVFNSSWIPETKEYFDDVVRRNEDGSYTAQTYSQLTNVLNNTEDFESIKDYLGY